MCIHIIYINIIDTRVCSNLRYMYPNPLCTHGIVIFPLKKYKNIRVPAQSQTHPSLSLALVSWAYRTLQGLDLSRIFLCCLCCCWLRLAPRRKATAKVHYHGAHARCFVDFPGCFQRKECMFGSLISVIFYDLRKSLAPAMNHCINNARDVTSAA